MEKDATGVATLTVSGKGQWRVLLSKEENDIVFGDGWGVFYKDNSLKVSDLLIFTYHGDLKFNVDIYDECGIDNI